MGASGGDSATSGLDPEQSQAVLAPRGPVCVLAGAGTGKTRTITRRIAHLVSAGHVQSGQVLAVTFTARAAGEMRTRLRDLGVGGGPGQPPVQARTFHAAALRQLRYFWPRVVGGAPWEVLEGKLRLVGQAAQRAGAPTTRESLRDLASEIEWAKASLVPASDYAAAAGKAARDVPAPVEQITAVYETYEALKNRAEMLDFDDLLLHTAAALEEHPEVAHEFHERYRCFVVDEFQDVTPAQHRLLRAWTGGRDDLTVVGDANQTIYSFAGASPSYLLDFPRVFPEATVVRLVRDYRSTPQVVSAANTVIGAARGRAAGSRLRLEGQRPPGPDPDFAEHDDEPAEATAVATAIRELVDDGVPPAEIAVLYRVNAQSEVYETALGDAGIAYQVRGGERFFQRTEVRNAVAALRTAATRAPEDARGEGMVTLVRAVLGEQGLTDAPPAGAAGQGAARQRWESLRALAELAEELVAAVPDADLAAFLAELQTRAQAQHPPTVQGVTLSSLHAAKGLEWDAVFLVGLTDGTLPIQHADGDDDAIEEERRLFYVGVTRARVHLRLSWALSRSAGGRRSRRRSRFLYGLVPDEHPAARQPTGRDNGSSRGKPVCRVCGKPLADPGSAKLGRCSTHPSDIDESLLEALKAWRSAEAKSRSVPAYVVFTDATLIALAEQRPHDPSGLVAIPGIGSSKLERYGDDVLSLVREHAS
ncbi:DNA helicase-2/ATP-dependent DNA helicase PcrA [Actinomycetospora succinea]|uniref:DNA 3'-5' helicase n=1 Tax=Actinomycetospora succinea TaxID=663603 RepID=A0A4R6V9R3_9PSEU|nr:ATP-dependent DNA helicase UvrD2 [Actinomycetospora succinea]TDQ58546.1 DNA helicase-2/ATP-dependent DNA helicase PcrA [Actinomycetospora succinea]